jgi:antitoxin (DNA-binding transcriptional repressor) of toxin-antitoxin stability system
MARKSDKRPVKRISATEASRSLSRVFDEVEQGRRFLVHRRGRNVCVMAPPPAHGRRASECLALLRARAPVLLDDDFGNDLLEVLAGESLEDRPSWDS